MPSDAERPRIGRRSLLLSAGALACSRAESGQRAAPSSVEAAVSGAPGLPEAGAAEVAPATSAAPDSDAPLLPASQASLDFPATPVGRISVVVALPERREGQRLPLLVALHGRGETLKGPERGARGWVDDYALARAAARLRRPPLTAKDFEGFVEQARLARLNGALAEVPHGGVAVACPFLPDILSSDDPFFGAAPYATFLCDVLLPKLRAEFPLLAAPAATGIDGVSLGGRAAIAVGLLRPDAFGAIGTLQAALEPKNAVQIVRRAREARERNPSLRLRLLTSSDDYYNAVTHAVHNALRYAEIEHDFLVVPGPHDYVFNRGPGALEMLAYHDRVLRGRTPI
ncbi:MAG TPA: alpha/beta hydrolase-fold protein [Polyangiaceae bacterium]